MKSLTKFVNWFVVALMLVMLAIMFVGCVDSDDEKEVVTPIPEVQPEDLGTFYKLEKAYQDGMISYQDIKSIAYYSGDIKEEGYAPQSKVPTELSESTILDIRKSRAFDINEWRIEAEKESNMKYGRVKVSDIEFGNYYGTYNGYIAIYTIDLSATTPDSMVDHEFDDIIINADWRCEFWLWKPNETVKTD